MSIAVGLVLVLSSTALAASTAPFDVATLQPIHQELRDCQNAGWTSPECVVLRTQQESLTKQLDDCHLAIWKGARCSALQPAYAACLVDKACSAELEGIRASLKDAERLVGSRPTETAPSDAAVALSKSLKACGTDSTCQSLLTFMRQHTEDYLELRSWCARYNRPPTQWSPGVASVCSAIGSYHSALASWSKRRLQAIKEEASASTEFDDAKARFETVKAYGRGHPEYQLAASNLVLAKDRLTSAKQRREEAASMVTRLETDKAVLGEIDSFDMFQLSDTLARPVRSCGGFGVLLPLVSARRLSGGEQYEVSGPVDAGIGGGYYWGVTCDENWTWGPQLFLYSEGLDPSKKFHIAAGTGVSLTAFKYFSFGVGVGYDLFRHRPGHRSNGALTWNGWESMSLLFTFGITSSSQNSESGSGASASGQAGETSQANQAH